MRGIGQILFSVCDQDGRLIMTAPEDTIFAVLRKSPKQCRAA
jgi:hypothetical protein